MRLVSSHKIRFGIVVAALSALLIQMAPSSYASASTPVGVYTGPGKVSTTDSFNSWLGGNVTYATDYVDYKGGWDFDFNPTWMIGPWGKWKTAQPNRKFVLGLPMLQNSNYGQFDQGAAGAFDSYFINLGKNMVANNLGDSIIRLGYEANCTTIGPWQATDNPAGYINDFRHLVSVMRAIPGSSFKFDWTVCNGLTNGHALNSFASFYPGDDVVDIMGLDQYDVKWQDTTVTPAQRWTYNVTRYMGMQDHKNFAAAHAKPVSYPEWGLYKPGDNFAGGGDDPYFIDQMADWIAASTAVYQSYFNIDWGGGVLANFPNGQAEYKARFGQPLSTTTPPPTTVTADTTAPTALIVSPTTGSTVTGTVTVAGSASDIVGVTRTELYMDGALKASATTAPYNFAWNTTGLVNGTHSLSLRAYDAAGNIGASAPVNVTVSNTTTTTPPPVVTTDTTAPVITSLLPATGSVVSGKINVTAAATDNMAVKRIDLYVNNKLVKSVTSGSIGYGLSTKAAGSFTVIAKAYDAAGNVASKTSTFTVL
jgi:hypothetical protein